MRFLLSSSIDTERFEAKTVQEAIKHYEEHLRWRSGGYACKDQYLCLIIAVHAEWNEYPTQKRGIFTILDESVKAISSSCAVGGDEK